MNNSVLFYDDNCSICLKFRNKIEELAPQGLIKFKDINNPECPPFEADKEELTFIDSHGNIHRGFNAVLTIAEIIPALRRFAPLMRSRLINKAGKGVYKFISDNRKRFCRTCGGRRR